MSTTGSKASKGPDARIAIVYSESKDRSNDSKNLALYFACCLANSGYALVFLVPCTPDGSSSDDLPVLRRLSFVPPGSSRAVDVALSHITFSHWSILESCNMAILTVNGSDNTVCASKFLQAVQMRKDIMVFCAHRGLRNSSRLNDSLSGKSHITSLECVVGFAVTQNPRTLAYAASTTTPCMAMPRFSEEVNRVAEGPVNLLEAVNIHILYRKTLTVFEWGVIIFEFIFAINIISGGTVIETFKDPCSRRVLATMIRETSEVLSVVSRSSKWKPSMELVSWMLTPWLLEMILCLPYYFIYLISFVTCLPLLSVPSVGQTDLLEGRSCVDTQSLLDLITTAKTVNIPIPVCQAIYDKIKSMESVPLGPGFISGGRSGSIRDVKVLSESVNLGNGTYYSSWTDSEKEFYYYLFRYGSLFVCFILTLLYLLYHESL